MLLLKRRSVPYDGEELISSWWKYVHAQVRTSYFLGKELLEECMNRIMEKNPNKAILGFLLCFFDDDNDDDDEEEGRLSLNALFLILLHCLGESMRRANRGLTQKSGM